MEDLISRLEFYIKKLVSENSNLSKEVMRLTQDKSQDDRQKEALITKQKNAISQLETLLSRLKSLEKPS